MKKLLKLSLCAGVLVIIGSSNAEVLIVDIELENDGIITTNQFPNDQPIFISGTSGLRFNNETANLLRISLEAGWQQVGSLNLGSLNLRIYDPTTGTVLNTLVLKPEAQTRFFASVVKVSDTRVQGSAIFSLDDFSGTVPQNQTLAVAILARMACGCSAFGSITISGEISVPNDVNQCGAIVNFPFPTTPSSCNPAACSVPFGSFFPVGTSNVNCFRFTGSASCLYTVTVEDTEAPQITCPSSISVAADEGQCSASVNPGAPSATDNCAVGTVTGLRSDAQSLDTPYPVGTTTIHWSATDATGNQSSCDQTVTVTAPSISGASAFPSVLWPPNHRLVNVTVDYTVSESCCEASTLLSATSNESDNGLGDGDTSNDIQVIDAHHLLLRSERSGKGMGRIYSITITATDCRGNSASKILNVAVRDNK